MQIGSVFEDQRYEALQVLEPHHKMWDELLGQMDCVEHHIDLMPDAKPHRSVPYRAGIRMRDIEKAEVDKMVEQGLAVPAPPTDWAAPVVFAPKKDDTMRFCIDYRRLNAITVRDAYPTPRMDECIDSLGDAKAFSTLCASSGYWQILIARRTVRRLRSQRTSAHTRYPHAVLTEERTSNLPTGHRYHTNHGKVAVRPCVLGRHHSLLVEL